MSRTIAVEHDGKTYSGQLALIESASLGWESHGILSAALNCTWKGGGISVGGFALDKSTGSPDYERIGTAYGLDHLIRIMRTVGVNAWEKLRGEQVIVLFDCEPGTPTWGMTAVGIAGTQNDEVLILKEHAESWREQAGAA